MSKFNIGDRVQIKGEPTDWDIGTVTECRSSFGEPFCDVTWDSSPATTHDEDYLYLVCAAADRPKPKHAAPSLPGFTAVIDGHTIDLGPITPGIAVNLASKLLQFATQEGTK